MKRKQYTEEQIIGVIKGCDCRYERLPYSECLG